VGWSGPDPLGHTGNKEKEKEIKKSAELGGGGDWAEAIGRTHCENGRKDWAAWERRNGLRLAGLGRDKGENREEK
jgi:hypothetical protein